MGAYQILCEVFKGSNINVYNITEVNGSKNIGVFIGNTLVLYENTLPFELRGYPNNEDYIVTMIEILYKLKHNYTIIGDFKYTFIIEDDSITVTNIDDNKRIVANGTITIKKYKI